MTRFDSEPPSEYAHFITHHSFRLPLLFFSNTPPQCPTVRMSARTVDSPFLYVKQLASVPNAQNCAHLLMDRPNTRISLYVRFHHWIIGTNHVFSVGHNAVAAVLQDETWSLLHQAQQFRRVELLPATLRLL